MSSGTETPAISGQNEKVRAARLSVISNTLLVALKLVVGLSIGSVAVISEAAHSATDLMAALIAFYAVRAADAPPDEDHPYGHGKVESLSGAIEALLIVGAAFYILYEAIRAITSGHGNKDTSQVGWGIAVMGLSAIVNTLIARHLFKVARKTDSIALEADAHHLSVDVWTSVGVVVGLALVWIIGLPIFDSLVAIVVALFILKTGYDIIRASTLPLVDARLPEEEIRLVEATMKSDPRILGWHKLRTRKAGSQRHIDVHIQVDDEMSLKEAHRLTEELEDRMRAALPNVEVMIHTEPYEEEMRHHEEILH
jgi:cation diffusion facilitator family transporter